MRWRPARVSARGWVARPGVALAPGADVGAGWGAQPGVTGCLPQCLNGLGGTPTAHPCRPSGTTARSGGGWRLPAAAYGGKGTCRGVFARSGWRVNAGNL
ncbi:hypothetical protein GCM10023257_28900 [Streptomyces hyderabadensis]|uniref:Uncharacterized protein n=1 Tax=Streptomyces hyderabadensis TaxID=598549 RepID=A0ABP9I3P9_9ACTN